MASDSEFMTSDGVVLAVHRYTDIDPRRPTIVAIHGWPDNHHVWDPVAEEFVGNYPGRYNVVAYDVRGAGESSSPAKRSGYAFAHLISDLAAVIDDLGVERVHLLAHDWGSIQAWAAITDQSVMSKIASLTSISGHICNTPVPFCVRRVRRGHWPRSPGSCWVRPTSVCSCALVCRSWCFAPG
ncbi:hypothetical protein X011_14510 [Mycobacterium tuberculosis variant microti OV254]|nr:hypothetical protein X011_14510 [Mycobacterium tuberculosis variant microti OV254]BBX39130.1 hypothetical protein MSIM_05810 [Mycobacterium simiae]